MVSYLGVPLVVSYLLRATSSMNTSRDFRLHFLRFVDLGVSKMLNGVHVGTTNTICGRGAAGANIGSPPRAPAVVAAAAVAVAAAAPSAASADMDAASNSEGMPTV